MKEPHAHHLKRTLTEIPLIEDDLAGTIALSPPGIELTLAEVYEEVAFPAPEPVPPAAVLEN